MWLLPRFPHLPPHGYQPIEQLISHIHRRDMTLLAPLGRDDQPVHNLSPHRPPNQYLALPTQPAHLLDPTNVLDRNGPHGVQVFASARPAHCRRRGSRRNVDVTLLSLEPRREVDWACIRRGLRRLYDAEAIACVTAAGGGFGAVSSERSVDPALGGVLQEAEKTGRTGFVLRRRDFRVGRDVWLNSLLYLTVCGICMVSLSAGRSQ